MLSLSTSHWKRQYHSRLLLGGLSYWRHMINTTWDQSVLSEKRQLWQMSLRSQMTFRSQVKLLNQHTLSPNCVDNYLLVGDDWIDRTVTFGLFRFDRVRRRFAIVLKKYHKIVAFRRRAGQRLSSRRHPRQGRRRCPHLRGTSLVFPPSAPAFFSLLFIARFVIDNRSRFRGFSILRTWVFFSFHFFWRAGDYSGRRADVLPVDEIGKLFARELWQEMRPHHVERSFAAPFEQRALFRVRRSCRRQKTPHF